MNARLWALPLLLLAPSLATAQGKDAVKPLLRLEAGGPTSNVTALAWAPDGKTLYAASFDKVVRAWKLAATGNFELDDSASFRVPIGPGVDGALNALALSSDGQWLAVGGFGVLQDPKVMKLDNIGRLVPVKGGFTPSMREERGLIYVFNTRDRSVKILRGHTGPVLNLTFAAGTAGDDKAPRLVSAAEGWDAQANKVIGEVIAWDVLKEESLGKRSLPPTPFAHRPGLILLRAVNDLRALLAWEDGSLFDWTVAANKLEATADAKFNIALALNPDGRRFLSAGSAGGNGVIQERNVAGLAVTGKREVPPQEDRFALPWAVGYVGDDAVAVVRFDGKGSKADYLEVFDARPGSFGQFRNRVELAKDNRILPVLATTPGGKHIAVAGFADHSIRVFTTASLVQGPPKMQVLHSAGTTMRFVRFVRKGDDTGVALAEKADAAAGDVVFDFTTRKLTTDVAAWADDVAAKGPYTVSAVDKEVRLSKNGAVVGTIKIEGSVITALAVMQRGDAPLVAIASYDPPRASTVLDLYHGESGQHVRRCFGHLSPIRRLSFRGDGKFLVSAAEDQTIAFWSLKFLGETIAKFGSLGNAAIEARAKQLFVLDPAGVENLAEGDRIVGLFGKDGQLKPLNSSAAFYESLWLREPGSTAKIRITRGGLESDVEVKVRQGVDVRKPIFQLFLPRDGAGKIGDWIGWNAIGPYDASRREVEKYLGWHFNTGRPEQPTSFAFIDQYRKEYYREGLLKEILALGELPPRPKAAAPKQVLLSPAIVQDGEVIARVGADYPLRKLAFDVKVTIPGYEPLPRDELTWTFDDGPVQAFGDPDGNAWSASGVLPPRSARHRISILLKRQPEGSPSQEFRAELPIRYQAPPPKVQLPQTKGLYLKVADKQFELRVVAQPASDGLEYQAELNQEVDGKSVTKTDLGKHTKPLDRTVAVTLRPGFNALTLTAANVGALVGADESTFATIQILLEEKKDAAPKISFDKPAGEVSETPTTIVKGRVVAEGAVAIEWDHGEGTPRKSAKLDAPHEGATPFKCQVSLKPGSQNIRVFAKTATSPEVTAQQSVVYRPQLPKLVVARPEEGFLVKGDTDEGRVTVDAELAPPEQPSPTPYDVTVEIAVGGAGKWKTLDKQTLRSEQARVRFDKVPLTPGDNAIRLTMRHAFGGPDQVQEVRGRYVRPPRVTALTPGPVDKKPFVDLTAEVTSPTPPLKDAVRVEVDGASASYANLSIEKGPMAGRWIVKATQVPLPAQKGKETSSKIRFVAATAEGDADMTLAEPVVYRAPAAAPPHIVLMEPAVRETTIAEPKLRVRFKVDSESDLSRVELTRAGQALKRWDAPARPKDGVYEFDVADVSLEWGLNELKLEVLNDGGARQTSLKVNVPPQPVQVAIESVQVGPSSPKIVPGPDGTLAPLPIGRATVYGVVRWSSFDDEALAKARLVRIFINGFQQLPVALKPAAAGTRMRRFEVPVVLNASDNKLEVDLPELKQDAGNRRKFIVPCSQPIRGQHLHVLVIAPQEKEDAKLVEGLARGLKAEKIGPNLYRTPVFDAVRFYVLARHVQLLEISSRLDRIAETLKERARAGSPNDLVMIYYQGKETKGSGGPILWTSETAPWLQMSLEDLSKNYLSRFAGGQVLILDTVSSAEELRVGDYRFAFLRRPDPRPLQSADRIRLVSEMEQEMPRRVFLDDLASALEQRVGSSFQSYVPEPLQRRIQLNTGGGAGQE
jgi:WD40 repeat protein